MNKAKLKTYAPAARRDFIRAVTDRAHLLGLAEGHTEPIEVSGEVALIGGRAYPKKIAALRYMELHGYLDHANQVGWVSRRPFCRRNPTFRRQIVGLRCANPTYVYGKFSHLLAQAKTVTEGGGDA